MMPANMDGPYLLLWTISRGVLVRVRSKEWLVVPGLLTLGRCHDDFHDAIRPGLKSES